MEWLQSLKIVWPTLASAESGSEKDRSYVQIEFLPGLLLFFPSPTDSLSLKTFASLKILPL